MPQSTESLLSETKSALDKMHQLGIILGRANLALEIGEAISTFYSTQTQLDSLTLVQQISEICKKAVSEKVPR